MIRLSRDRSEMDRRRRTHGPNPEPINPEMGEGRWQDALRRMRDRIEAGLEFSAEDSDETGNKFTRCSWGMCSDDREQWPEADDHVWPESFTRNGRIAPRNPGDGAGCPLDTRAGTEKEGCYGCFYTCRVFTKRQIRGEKHRLVVLNHYNVTIEAREEAHGRRTAADDEEPWRS